MIGKLAAMLPSDCNTQLIVRKRVGGREGGREGGKEGGRRRGKGKEEGRERILTYRDLKLALVFKLGLSWELHLPRKQQR